MTTDKKTLTLPILFIVVGIGWLLTNLEIGPNINWAWSLGLGAIGVLTFTFFGIDKVSVVLGPFFILASTFSILRQSGRLHFDIEVPIMVIVFGVLLLVARSSLVPIPDWVPKEARKSTKSREVK